MVSGTDWDERLRAFDAEFDNSSLEQAIREIELFNQKFPRSSVEALTKAEYALAWVVTRSPTSAGG
jgi:hypothetical protein